MKPKVLLLSSLMVFVLLAIVVPTQLSAVVPQVVNYQGRLTTSGGTPVADGNYQITFQIYTALSGGTSLWNSGAQTVAVGNGLFNVKLGASPMTALPDNLFSADTARYLGITVASDPEISPRTQITSVGYAYQSLRADSAKLALAVAPNTVTSTSIVDGTIAPNDLANNAVTNPKLAPGSVNTPNIMPNAVTSMEIAPGAVTNPKLAPNSVANANIQPAAVATLNIQPSAVTTNEIANNTILLQDIAQNGAAAGQIMKWNGTGWAIANDSVGSASSASCNWTLSDSVLYTNRYWGLARGNATNLLYGTNKYTMVNWGNQSTTGTSGENVGFATVSGGYSNTASKSYSTVAGGSTNSASAAYAVVGGGDMNSATAIGATVAGGFTNISSSQYAAVCGGISNTAVANAAFVGGGVLNNVVGANSVVAGGYNNVANGTYNAVGGGQDNNSNGAHATIGGGQQNVATNDHAVVCGGWQNTVIGLRSAIGGGHLNQIHSVYSSIPGGEENFIQPPANYSLAFGWGVDVIQPFRTEFYDGARSGQLQINHDDLDPVPPMPYVILVGTNPGNGNAAFLSPGGIWTNTSSRATKENFQTLGREELLNRIASLPVESWNYKNSTERHIGPCAEEFVGAFGVGVANQDGSIDNKHLSASDVAGVALAGVKGSIQQAQELKAAIQSLTEQLYEKTSEIDEMKAQIQKLTELVQMLTAAQGK